MTREQRIEAAQKRIKELELLIKSWSKKWDIYLMSQVETINL